MSNMNGVDIVELNENSDTLIYNNIHNIKLGMIYPNYKLSNIIEILIKFAKNSPLIYKHSACILNGNKIYGIGVNKYFNIKNEEKSIKISVHAEVDALASVNTKYLKGMDILIIRVGKSYKLRYSRPCNACIDKLKQKGIRKAYYSDNDGNILYEFVDTMPKIHESAGSFNKRKEKSCDGNCI